MFITYESLLSAADAPSDREWWKAAVFAQVNECSALQVFKY